MGEVWTARRSALGGAAKLMAVKMLLPEKASDPSARKLFLDEARLAMLLTNSNIVQVFDVGEDGDGTCYMAMELVDGIDLAQLTEHLSAAGEQLSLSAVAYIVGEILKALAYAHEFDHEGERRTIVHRDISPHNVMLSVSGEVKLMDFGVARLASEDTSGIFVRGKIRYMPPEQLDGGSREPTIDLFAVGALLHELLDGKKFRGGMADEARLLGMCIKGEAPPLRCSRERVPPQLERLRTGLLAPAAKHRIPSARAAHRMLSQWPGDRDAKFELGDIVQRVVNPALSRTVTWSVHPNPIEIPVGDGSDTDMAFTQTRDSTGGRDSDEESRTVTAVSVIARQSSRRFAPPDARHIFVGLGLAIASTGAVIGLQPDEGANEAPAVVETEIAEFPKPIMKIPDAIAESPAAKTEPAAKSTRTSVAIAAATVWSQVKIAGKVYTLDRLKGSKIASARLAPGRYTVSFRDDPEASWRSVGRVTIPESRQVTLQIVGGVASIRR